MPTGSVATTFGALIRHRKNRRNMWPLFSEVHDHEDYAEAAANQADKARH
jgi:hypothetical protein